MSETLPDRIFLSEPARQESREFSAWFVRCSAMSSVGIQPVVEPPVSAEFAATMSNLLDAIGSGRTITIGALPDELTTSVAAEQMGVSRTTLMKWIREGTLPAHKVGTHTRLKTTDVMNLRKARAARQRKALEELLALESELDIQ